MQGSNSVSNDVIWARIKKKRKKKRDRKAISKGLFYKNASWKTILPDEKALIVMMAMVRNTCWNNKRVQRKLYIYIYIYIWVLYIREILYLDTLFLDERDASVDCVIVLYDWKLIIYSLMPTRLLLLCLLC